MTEYQWRSGMPAPKVDANVFGAIKDEIENQFGTVQPGDIVEEAKKPNSPIRELFEWSDKKAADKFRLDQARHYLGALQVVRVSVENGPTISSRAMYRVRPQNEKPGYASQDRIVSDKHLRRQVIASARKELESFVGKYASVLAMGTFVPRLREVVDEMRDEIERLETDANARRSPTKDASGPPQPAIASH